MERPRETEKETHRVGETDRLRFRKTKREKETEDKAMTMKDR